MNVSVCIRLDEAVTDQSVTQRKKNEYEYSGNGDYDHDISGKEYESSYQQQGDEWNDDAHNDDDNNPGGAGDATNVFLLGPGVVPRAGYHIVVV